MRHVTLGAFVLLGACAVVDDPAGGGPAAGAEGELAVVAAALDGAPRTIPYGGYVDFDGEPVNAGNVKFNFALFPCATPGTGAGQCAPDWVARGTWNAGAADWKDAWPTGLDNHVKLPIFSGRFTVELGGAGQNELPDVVIESQAELFLAIQIEGRTLAALQKLVPAPRAITSFASAQALPGHDFVVDAEIVDEAGVPMTIPSGAVVPFELDDCPPGWTEYAPAYGRFVRGIDRSGEARDPDGERAPGSVQDDMLASHSHAYVWMKGDNNVDGVDSVTTYHGEHHNEDTVTGATGGAETRPKNVALLYCRRD